MTVCEHLVATTRGRVRSLVKREHAQWLWQHLREKLPTAFACVLMPDHVHVVAPVGLRDVFAHVVAAFTARFRVRFDVLDPQPGHSEDIAHRQIRDVLLNPVRERLVDDPWRWPWSTLRDLAGAVHPIWTPAERVATLLDIPRAELLRAMTWTADGRPVVPERQTALVASFAAICRAVCATLRIADVRDDALARTLVIQTAHAIAPLDATRLASQLACSRRTIFRDRGTRHAALDAVLLSLSDARLQDESTRPRELQHATRG